MLPIATLKPNKGFDKVIPMTLEDILSRINEDNATDEFNYDENDWVEGFNETLQEQSHSFVDGIKYNDIVYPSRCFLVEVDGIEDEYYIAVESLQEAMGESVEDEDSKEYYNDSQVYYYITDAKICGTPEEIVKEAFEGKGTFIEEF